MFLCDFLVVKKHLRRRNHKKSSVPDFVLIRANVPALHTYLNKKTQQQISILIRTQHEPQHVKTLNKLLYVKHVQLFDCFGR